MRVLVTGAAGQVGHELMRLVPEGVTVSGFDSSQLDITNIEQVHSAVAQVKPDLIINAAAYTAVDKAETESEQAWAVNHGGVANLAAAAVARDIPVLHISTDYVFDGESNTAYLETDPPGPTGVYGDSKLAGEQALARLCDRHIVLRTSWVFGVQGNNFVKTMLRLGRERDVLGVVADQYGGPTPAADIARALWQLALQWQTIGELPWGTYHFCGQPAVSWYGFAEAVFNEAKALGLLSRLPRVNAITTADFPTPARRPAWSVLDCSKLEADCGIAQPDWHEGLREVLQVLGSET